MTIREAILNALLVLIIAAGFACIGIQWISGCGEHWIDSRGMIHSYECYQLPVNRSK